jgi:hypothetical protein
MKLRLALIFICPFICTSVFAQNPIEKFAEKQQAKFDNAAVRGNALVVLSKWRDKILAEKKNGLFLVDAKDTLDIAKSEHSSNVVFGIKSVCRNELKPGGVSNILDPNAEKKVGLSVEQKTAIAAIRKVFDDPSAKCKNPKNGFVIHAVTFLKTGELKDWSLDDKKLVQEVNHLF